MVVVVEGVCSAALRALARPLLPCPVESGEDAVVREAFETRRWGPRHGGEEKPGVEETQRERGGVDQGWGGGPPRSRKVRADCTAQRISRIERTPRTTVVRWATCQLQGKTLSNLFLILFCSLFFPIKSFSFLSPTQML